MTTIDLNCDLGERAELAVIDEQLLAIVTSANIACGGHAGDDSSMARTVRAALTRGVGIGAHPSFPDRTGFGRDELPIDPALLEASIAEQVARLANIARSLGAAVTHVKPHGALYHAAMSKQPIADAISRGCSAVGPGLVLVGQAGAGSLARWRSLGHTVAAEAFADRLYEPDGTLRSRKLPGALIHDPAAAARQALWIARNGQAITADGSILNLQAQTICIHSDTPGSVGIAAAVRSTLEQHGIQVRPLARDARRATAPGG